MKILILKAWSAQLSLLNKTSWFRLFVSLKIVFFANKFTIENIRYVGVTSIKKGIVLKIFKLLGMFLRFGNRELPFFNVFKILGSSLTNHL